jgi:hypothetical protein
MSLTKLSLAGNNLSLVSDIPAGEGKIANLFLQCGETAMSIPLGDIFSYQHFCAGYLLVLISSVNMAIVCVVRIKCMNREMQGSQTPLHLSSMNGLEQETAWNSLEIRISLKILINCGRQATREL